MNLHRFDVNIPIQSGDSEFFVKMDGKRIYGIRDISIHVPLEGPPTITMEILAQCISGAIDAETKIAVVDPRES